MRFALFVASLVAIVSAGVPAFAQSDTRGLVDRLDRLERDLGTLQSQVYRSPSVITSPALGGSGAASSQAPHVSGTIAGDAYSSLDQRINNLDQQMRDLTGQMEKNSFAISQLGAKLDRSLADTDLRLKELEQKAGIGGTGAAPAAANQAAPPPPQGGTTASPAGALVHPGTAAPPPTSAGAASAMANKTPQEQYDYAFGLLRNNDYDGANKAFQAFIAQHPQDPLAGNATYWLGQIPYSQGQWDQAAPLFLNAYSKYPKSAKAGESLLKLGLSLSNLGKKKEACAALTRFATEFPDAGDSLKRTSSSEKSKLGC